MNIRPFDIAIDAQPVFALWGRCFPEEWAISPSGLWRGISAPVANQQSLRWIATTDNAKNEIVGFIAIQVNLRATGATLANVSVMMVAPEYQRQGIGSQLIDTAIQELKARGVTRLMVSGFYPRLFPGVPVTMTGTLTFFGSKGWEFPDQDEVDLVADLTHFELPADIQARMATEHVTLAPVSTEADLKEVLALQDREFPGWATTYYHVAKLNPEDILIARDSEHGILGALLMSSPHSHPIRSEQAWHKVLGDNLGSMGEVGVAVSGRGRGIGLALVAYGSAILRARGVGNCIIGWTTLTEFYGKLGYQVWRRYKVGTLEL